jgi:Transport and Golgi organisation 2
MCTVIIHVPEDTSSPTRLLAVRDEDPGRAWDPLGAWWPQTHPGVVGVRDTRAGGAWLAADSARGRVAVILNRAELVDAAADAVGSRGHVVLDAVDGRGPGATPAVHGFNLVEVDAGRARVTMWDGAQVRTALLAPGIHMIAHDDVDDDVTARIVAWREAFEAPADGATWWAGWMDTLERSALLDPTDDRAIIRDNRPYGYPTLSLLVCAAEVTAGGAEVVYGELDRPGRWNRPALR